MSCAYPEKNYSCVVIPLVTPSHRTSTSTLASFMTPTTCSPHMCFYSFSLFFCFSIISIIIFSIDLFSSLSTPLSFSLFLVLVLPPSSRAPVPPLPASATHYPKPSLKPLSIHLY